MGGTNSHTLHIANNKSIATIMGILLVFLVILKVPTIASAQFHDMGTGLSSKLTRSLSNSPHHKSSRAVEHSITDTHHVKPNFTFLRRLLQHFCKSSEDQLSHRTYSTDRKPAIFGMEKKETASGMQYDPSGAFLAQVNFGTPSQHFEALVDTRSSLTSIQCGTYAAEHESVIYYPGNSTTYKANLVCKKDVCESKRETGKKCPTNPDGCLYVFDHNGVHYDGHLAQETFYFSTGTAGEHLSPPLLKFIFGCGLHDPWKFKNAVGVLGLARGDVGLVKQKHFANFSYCLPEIYAHRPNASRKFTNLLVNMAMPPPRNMLWTYLSDEEEFEHPYSTFYNLELLGIHVNDIEVPIGRAFVGRKNGSGGMFLDSTTEFTTLAKGAYYPLLSTIKSSMLHKTPVDPPSDVDLELCYDIKGDQSIFPKMTFEFVGLYLELPKRNVFVQSSKVNREVACLAFKQSINGIGYSLFGLVQQQGFQVIVDLDENRVGFAPDQC